MCLATFEFDGDDPDHSADQELFYRLFTVVG